MSEVFSQEVPQLLQSHFDQLHTGSGIDVEVIKERGYMSILGPNQPLPIMEDKTLKQLNFKVSGKNLPGIFIPLWGPDGDIAGCQYRADAPRIDSRGREIKYETPAGASLCLDVPPQCRKHASDISIELFVVEGAKKGDSLVSRGALAVVTLSGVWGWISKNKHGGKAVSEAWRDIPLNDRIIHLGFDSDTLTNPSVYQALEGLTELIRRRRGHPFWIIPSSVDGKKVGADDYLLTHTLEEYKTLAQDTDTGVTPKPSEHEERYSIENFRIGRWAAVKKPITMATLLGGVEETEEEFLPLCDFQAGITREIHLDNGQEEAIEFEIKGTIPHPLKEEEGIRLPPIRVPAKDFSRMDWVVEKWGYRAEIRPGQSTKDMVRDAIQYFSIGKTIEVKTFTHTGWREIDGKPYFLTSGSQKASVELPPELERYSLPEKCGNPKKAFEASARFLDIAPLKVTLPLWSVMYLAPLCVVKFPNFTLWILGPTGAMKSTLAALVLNHIGDFTYDTLPANWRSTANSLEKTCFLAKDIPLVIDNFTPQETIRKQREMEDKAQWVVQAQGDRAGRNRLRSDTSTRGGFIPRGVLISTGEQLPQAGQAELARIFGVSMERSDIDIKKLTEAQGEADQYRYAMRGYIDWLAPQLESLEDSIPRDFILLRQKALRENEHLRVPEVVTYLFVGLQKALQYGESIGAVNKEEIPELLENGWNILLELGTEQAKRIEKERPTLRFIHILLTLFAQQKAYLNAKDGGKPEEPLKWGWIKYEHYDEGERKTGYKTGPIAELLGWVDDIYAYLLPDAAYRAVAKFCGEEKLSFTTPKRELLNALEKERYLIPFADGKHSGAVWCEGITRRVVRIILSKLDESEKT